MREIEHWGTLQMCPTDGTEPPEDQGGGPVIPQTPPKK